ncbi:MAG: hypothetical protein DRI57_14600 [Deltaproteobacteria bacterium]|nr:MAG: hypothetical protein DRI57_14600 [Deltaproteobacteria bacterium]
MLEDISGLNNAHDPGSTTKHADYNGFRGALNQKSIPLKTTESRREPQRPYNSVVLCASSVVLCDCQGIFTGLP